MTVRKKTDRHHFTRVNRVRLIRGGKDYFNLLHALIQDAKESIHLQYYIFNDDETGSLVADALKKQLPGMSACMSWQMAMRPSFYRGHSYME